MALPGLLLVPLTILTLQAQGGVRARTDTVTKNAGVDLLAIPSATVAMTDRDWTLTLGTSSSAFYLDVFSPERNTFAFTQALIAAFSYRLRRASITISQNAQAGHQNLRLNSLTLGGSPLAPAPNPNGPLPGNGGSSPTNGALRDETLDYGALSTTVVVSEMVSRETSLGQYARFTTTSGLGNDVESYPSQLSFGGGLSAQHRVSQKDAFGLQGWTDRISTRGFSPVVSIGLGFTWNHSLSARLTGYLNLGGSYIFPESTAPNVDGISPPPALIYPNIALGINLDKTPFTVTVGMIPVIDQISGQVDTRVTGTLQYSERKGRINYTAGIGTATSVNQDRFGAFVSFFGNASAGYSLTRELELTAGGGTSYQLAPYLDDENSNNGSAIIFGQLSLNFTPRGIRL